MRKRVTNRTWPVFVIGLGSLLALLFLPGVAALRRSDRIYREIRRIEADQQATQKSLAEIERRLYLVSIAVREALLDTAPVEGNRYRITMAEGRESIGRELAALRQNPAAVNIAMFGELEAQLKRYWELIDPVFHWTPEERAAKGMYFLREQQRPRRQEILAVAASISALTERSYQKQYNEITASQREFRDDLERAVALAFFLGTIIAGATILRISVLESRSAAERRKAETAEEKLRSLSTQLMHAQEEERKSISRELHDEVGQMLTGLRMQIAALERSRQDVEAFQEHVLEAKSLSEQSLRSVRDLAVGLRPSVLDLGLRPALQWQARHFSRLTGLRVSVHADGELDDVPDAERTCVYRVVQESLTNAARHSGAKNVNVFVERSGARLHVRIHDDGTGFKTGNGKVQGIGVIGMQERVRELGGSFRVETQPGQGTDVVVELRANSENG